MAKNTYPFHPDLKKYENMSPPVIPAVVPVLQKLMGVLYSMEKSDADVEVSALRIPAWDGTDCGKDTQGESIRGESARTEKRAQLRALLYAPVGASDDGPCLLFFHGGGFVYNAAPHHFSLARRMAKALGWKTVLVDYRLAPKYQYPTAPEDCFCAYRWIMDNASALKIDPARIAVCGDSAGGNLAAAVCLMARDRGVPMPKAQMLLYPVTDWRMSTESMGAYTDTPMCNSRDMEKYMAMYLKTGTSETLEYLSLVETKSLTGLPAAYVEVAEYDCLRDEGIAYARALEAAGRKAADAEDTGTDSTKAAGVDADSTNTAGTPVELHEVKGAMHGYDIAENSELVRELIIKRAGFLKKSV